MVVSLQSNFRTYNYTTVTMKYKCLPVSEIEDDSGNENSEDVGNTERDQGWPDLAEKDNYGEDK